MAPQHIHGQDVLVEDFLCPCGQRVCTAPLQGINHQPWQKEIIDGIAFGGQLFVDFFPIGCVNFREQGHTISIRYCLQPCQKTPCTWFIQKVTFPHGLMRISESVQPHDRGSIPCQRVQRVGIKFPHQWRSHIQIHLSQIPAAGFQQVGQFAAQQLPAAQLQFRRALARLQLDLQAFGQGAGGLVLHAQGRHQFPRIGTWVVDLLVEGVPVGLLSAVGHPHHQNGQPRFAEKHLMQVLRCRLYISPRHHLAAACPERVPIYEEVLILRRLAVFQ